ncbi:MAG: DUF87 domain-containing protein [Candidatus Micrarchaeota archaeon]|nr:DUF87 domain-containing protein [Candidatus Micrarchaeota archaeon]MBU1886347.1 DUF87 domain-containing protein [Candidatus Micrarchaeota archaeon]
MAYDIPDEIKYREKIIFNLDWKQLGYAAVFGLLSFFSYNAIQLQGELRFVIPAIIGITGIGFIFLNIDEKARDVISYYAGIRKEPFNSKKAQRFFEVKEIRDNAVHLEDGRILAILQVYSINFELLDENRKAALLANYKAFLNQLTVPVQILIRTEPISLSEYFRMIELNNNRKKELIISLYADFKKFEEDFIDNSSIKERSHYLIIPFEKDRQLNEIVKITMEKLAGCGLKVDRLGNRQLRDLYFSYAEIAGEHKPEKTELKKEEESTDFFRNMLTPSFDIKKDYAIVNSEFHKIVKVTGYPRKVEDGWLQTFLTKNESYDISIHITPSTIAGMLVYLHNQIIQQTGDLFASTMKGTPNPALEIKKADTIHVYDSLYKGEEKMFSVSAYVDNKAAGLDDLDLLAEKCKSNLNAQLMIPKITEWRMADGIKSTLPLAHDTLLSQRDFLTNSLAATFPFISPVDTKKRGILFAHEADTLNPIFLDLEEMSNKHFFVIGISGSGKSYTSKYLMMQQLFKEDTKVYILDPNGEYSALCETMNGQIIELSRKSGSNINIFDLAGEDFGNKMLSLISAFDIIVGGLTENQKSVLNKALIRAYKRKGIVHDKSETWNKKAPTFGDMRTVLLEIRKRQAAKKEHTQDFTLESLLNRVEMYCEGNIFGFLDEQSRIEIEKGFVCFDLSQLPNAVKNLMMFATLEIIQREIKRDRKQKVVLIDEGWSLLRSKEATDYIMEFVKTSRKYNTSLGFITQEIEDLLGSKAGRSILNTASVKILMRQNPSNIALISKVLQLNEQAKIYLLTASRGFGLLITEQNTYKFFIKASEKVHGLITTNPKEFTQKAEVEKTEEKKPRRISLKKGLYLESDLTEKECNYLLSHGYVLHKSRLEQSGGSSRYVLKIRHNESPEHAFLCQKTVELLKKNKAFRKIEMSTMGPGDVSAEIKGKRIAFEIETGENFRAYSKEEHEEKFDRVRKSFDDFYIIVTDYDKKYKYEKFGNVITRTEIEATINQLTGNSPPSP